MAVIRPSPCPNCHDLNVRKLAELSYMMSADYHRCGGCDHVWTTDKSGHIQTHITPLRRETARDPA